MKFEFFGKDLIPLYIYINKSNKELIGFLLILQYFFKKYTKQFLCTSSFVHLDFIYVILGSKMIDLADLVSGQGPR